MVLQNTFLGLEVEMKRKKKRREEKRREKRKKQRNKEALFMNLVKNKV